MAVSSGSPRPKLTDFRVAHGRPLLIGHRGAPGYRPEHTASSYRLAMQHGVDFVEPDVVCSRDGVLVIRHENEISGTTDVADRPQFAEYRRTKIVDGKRITGWFVEDFTWEELSVLRCTERIPRLRPANTLWSGAEPMLRLRDLLQLVDEEREVTGNSVGVVIELKHAHYYHERGYDFAVLVSAELREAGWEHRSDEVIFESFEIGVLERIRALGFPGARVMLTETSGSPADRDAVAPELAHDWAWFRGAAGLDCIRDRVHGISVAKSDLFDFARKKALPRSRELVEQAHARGLAVFVWTLRPENKFLFPCYQLGSNPSEPGGWKAEWQAILGTGVDGVFTDQPDLVAGLTHSAQR